MRGMCELLGASEKDVQWLVKKGYLTAVKWPQGIRFLEPTPAYLEKLNLCEALYDTERPLPKDLDFAALLTITEVAEIVGWKLDYARQFMRRKKIKSVKAGRYSLYSVEAVRDILWSRRNRSLAKQKAPFLLVDLVKWFLARQENQAAGLLTDSALLEDEELVLKFSRLLALKSPDREKAIRDLWEKIETAKAIAQVVR